MSASLDVLSVKLFSASHNCYKTSSITVLELLTIMCAPPWQISNCDKTNKQTNNVVLLDPVKGGKDTVGYTFMLKE